MSKMKDNDDKKRERRKITRGGDGFNQSIDRSIEAQLKEQLNPTLDCIRTNERKDLLFVGDIRYTPALRQVVASFQARPRSCPRRRCHYQGYYPDPHCFFFS